MDPLTLLLLGWAFMTRGAGASPTVPAPTPTPKPTPKPKPMPMPAPAPAPVPVAPGVAVPVSLTDTSFPGPRWELDQPPSQAVQARALELLPSLWTRGAGAHIVEDMGPRMGLSSRPTGFRAEHHGTKKAVSAWRLKPGTVMTHPTSTPAMVEQVVQRTVAAPKPAAPPPPPPPSPAQKSGLSLPTLRRGSTGTDVQVAQQRLGRGLVVDGKFGPATEAAVIDFQAKNGLAIDGVIGPQTWGALFEETNA